MGGALGFFAMLLFFCMLVVGGIDLSQKIITDDNTFEATRTTQLTTLNDCINIGDFIVNHEITIDSEYTKEYWCEIFDNNSDLGQPYIIKKLDVHENPAGIAVELSYENELKSRDETSITEYFNCIIVDGLKE